MYIIKNVLWLIAFQSIAGPTDKIPCCLPGSWHNGKTVRIFRGMAGGKT